MSYNPYNYSHNNYYNYRDRKEKGGQGGGQGGYNNQADAHQYYYERNGYNSSSYPTNYNESKSRDYYYPSSAAEFDYDRRRPPPVNVNEGPARGGSNYRGNNHYDSRGFNPQASGGKGANYTAASSSYYNYAHANPSAYYGAPYSSSAFYGYSNSTSSNYYQGNYNNASGAAMSSSALGKNDKFNRQPPTLSDSPTRSRQYSFGAKRLKRMAGTKLDWSNKESGTKEKPVKEEKEPEKEVIKDPVVEQMVRFTSAVIDNKINSLLLALNLKLTGIKEVAKPVVNAPDNPSQATQEKAVVKPELANKSNIKGDTSVQKEDCGVEPMQLKPTPLKRSASNISDGNMSAKKQKMNNNLHREVSKERSEHNGRLQSQERSSTPKVYGIGEETMKRRDMSVERDPRSPEEFRFGRKLPPPPPSRDSRNRGSSADTPTTNRLPPSTADPYYQDYQGKQYPQQQFGYDYYAQRDWGYDNYNQSYDRGAPAGERGYNYGYDYNQPAYDHRGATSHEVPYQNRMKDDRVDRADHRGVKMAETNSGMGGGAHRPPYENRDAWSTPAGKGGRNRENVQSGRGPHPHTGSQQKKNPSTLRTPR